MVFSYAAAPAVIVTPFLYASIITATILGFIVFGDFPSHIAWLGIVILIGSGIFLTLKKRET